MKVETRQHIDRAQEVLRRADASLAATAVEPLAAEDAARNAYYAAFHAAKALIMERSGGTTKKHGSVHRMFENITLADASIDKVPRDFLGKSYEYKRIGDYETGAAAHITPAEAQAAVAEAKRFVAVVAALLP